MEPSTYSTTNRDIIQAIGDLTRYESRTGYQFEPEYITSKKNYTGTEAEVWINDPCCQDAICFEKGGSWMQTNWHRTGLNYTEGDSLKYQDRNDLNATLDFFWNVTKYFCVDPNCWFENDTFTTFDSPEDGDSLNDSIRVNFTINTVMPCDFVKVNASLRKAGIVVVNKTVNYTVTSDGLAGSITLTVPEDEEPGWYNCRLYLYNSTGRINEMIDLDVTGNYYNDTIPYPFDPNYYLYPYNQDTVPPDITDVKDTPDPIGFGFDVTISANVSDVDGVDTVKVNIVKPQADPGQPSSYFMINTVGDTYEYVFNDTWQNGQYNYTIWAIDEKGYSNTSSQFSFNVSAMQLFQYAPLKTIMVTIR